MKPTPPFPTVDEEISALIETLHQTGQRLEQLTAGEVDSVADRDGRAFLLQHVQQQLLQNDAARQAAILNALPANIALLDTQGRIVSVNLAWRQFAEANALLGPQFEIGVNYLAVCDRAQGDGAVMASEAAAGIRAVLAGEYDSFALEYPCHSPTRQRWFLMTVSALARKVASGAVVMHLDITERKQNELALHESERRFSDLLGNVALISVMLDRDARVTYCNDYLLRLTGRRHDEVIGCNWFDLFLPPDLGTMKGQFFTALLANLPNTWHHENEILTSSGERRLVRWNNSVLRSSTGEVTGTASIGEDITERQRHEREILATRNKLQATLDAIPDPLFEIGLDGRYYAYHSPRTDLLAAPPEALLGRTVSEVLPDDAAKVVLAALAEAQQTGRSAGRQFELDLPQGRLVFELSVAVMAVEEGEAPRFICLSRDISDRRRIERQLDESERLSAKSKADAEAISDIAARLQAILDTVADGVITIDQFGIVETLNPSAERIFGHAAAAVVGQNIKMLMPEPQHSEHDAYLGRYRRGGDPHIIGVGREVTGQRKDGSTFPLELAVSELMLGGVRHYTGVLRDITERKATEQEISTARIVAERANAAKDTFLANMSHEIRTPMNGVIGMIEVLQQSSLNAPQMEMANVIRDSAFALLGVINDILDFSKIEAGKLEIEQVPMNVADVVEKACKMMDRMAMKKEVELTLFTDPAIPAVLAGDPGRLRQVLINLSNNAIKFSSGKGRSGRVSVRVLLVEQNAERATLEFQVADNGVGIDQENIARLFSPFIQADASTTRLYGGTGLGLSISRQLVTMMGGEIKVQSAPDEGALFSVRIPLARLAASERNDRRPPSEPVADRQLVAGLSCLVVGHSAGIADHLADDLAAYLKHGDAQVERTADLTTARQWIAGHPAGRPVVIIDTRLDSPPLAELRIAANEHAGTDTHFVAIRRGPRRGLRVDDSHLVSVDGNVLTRRTLLTAVAIAAGRTKAPGQEVLPDEVGPTRPRPSADTVRRRGSRILVAEDNDINQRVIVHQLSLLGYLTDLAEDGHDALNRWHQGDHALLLTDLHMPEMDGFALTAAIRRAENAGTHLPIIALTANALKSEELRCKAAGMDDYLTKPVLLDRLQATLEKWLPIPVSPTGPAGPPAPSASATLAVLDRSVLPGLIGDDPPLIVRFFKDYLLSAENSAREIRTGIGIRDWRMAGTGAHKLKSSSRAVGALALGEVCSQLERAAGELDGKPDGDAVLGLAGKFEAALAAALGAIGQKGA